MITCQRIIIGQEIITQLWNNNGGFNRKMEKKDKLKNIIIGIIAMAFILWGVWTLPNESYDGVSMFWLKPILTGVILFLILLIINN